MKYLVNTIRQYIYRTMYPLKVIIIMLKNRANFLHCTDYVFDRLYYSCVLNCIIVIDKAEQVDDYFNSVKSSQFKKNY